MHLTVNQDVAGSTPASPATHDEGPMLEDMIQRSKIDPYLFILTRREYDALTPQNIRVELEKRYALLQTMVGQFYPAMVRQECYTLRSRYIELTGTVCPI